MHRTSTKTTGVRIVGKSFQAYCSLNRKFVSIGYFDTMQAALDARAGFLETAALKGSYSGKKGRPCIAPKRNPMEAKQTHWFKSQYETLKDRRTTILEKIDALEAVPESQKDYSAIHWQKHILDRIKGQISDTMRIIDRAFDLKVFDVLPRGTNKAVTRGLERMCTGFFEVEKDELTFRIFLSYSPDEIISHPVKFGKASYYRVIQALEELGYSWPVNRSSKK